jgi:hypothetical protein
LDEVSRPVNPQTSGCRRALDNVVAGQYPHQYINRNIPCNIDTEINAATNFYLAKVIMKLQDKAAQTARVDNNGFIINHSTGITGAVKVTAQVFNKPVYG